MTEPTNRTEPQPVDERVCLTEAGAQALAAAEQHTDQDRTYVIPTAGGDYVDVRISRSVTDSTWFCLGCSDGDSQFSDLQTLADAGTHAAMCGRGTVASKLEKDLANFRGELARVDAKASSLLTVAGVALSVGLAVLGRAQLPTAAAVVGWFAVALLGAGVVLLALAIRPNLAGTHGLVRYAKAANGEQLLADLAHERRTRHNPVSDLSNEVGWTAKAAYAKHLRVRRSVTLLLTGLAATAITAVLALVLA